MSSVLTDFDTWKSFLGERVKEAKKAGMSDETLNRLAFEIGQFLDKRVDPKNDEQRLLKELWDVGDDQERRALARMMVKWVERK